MRWGAFVLVSIYLFLLFVYGMVVLRESLLESKVPDHNPKLASRIVRNPQFMGDQFGFTSPPIYITSLKLYANFFIGLLMLLGIRLTMQRCCPSRFHPQQYNAFSDKKVGAGIGDKYSTLMDVEHYAGSLHAGHVLVGPRGENGQVVYSLPFSRAISLVRPMLRVDFSGDVRNFIDKDGLMGDGIVHSFSNSNMDEFRLENMRDLRELHEYGYVDTLRSKFLADFNLTLLSLLFQLAVVLSTMDALVEIYTQPIPFQARILLFNQHTAAATLTVCVAQTLVMVRKARQDAGTNKKIAAWFLLILSLMIYLPTTLSALFIGWYGFLWYFFPSIPFGLSLLYVFVFILVRKNFVRKRFFWEGTIHTGPWTGIHIDDFLASEYDDRTPSGKAWFLITHYIPLQGAASNLQLLIIVTYMLFGTLAAPLWWLVLCGFSNAWSVAGAFMFEVILPLIFVLLLSVIVVVRNAYNMNKAGVVMILSFAMAQVCFSFMSVLLPASILLLHEDMQVKSALPKAFDARQGAMYMTFLMKPILSESEAASHLVSRAWDLACSQLLSWWT